MELRRELASEGFGDAELERHKDAIKSYVKVLLEQEMSPIPEDLPEDDIRPEDSISQVGRRLTSHRRRARRSRRSGTLPEEPPNQHNVLIVVFQS